jgi:hypothetical protein
VTKARRRALKSAQAEDEDDAVSETAPNGGTRKLISFSFLAESHPMLLCLCERTV